MSRQRIKQNSETMKQYMARMKRNREARLNARARREAYADAGLKRVRGALGGVYYE